MRMCSIGYTRAKNNAMVAYIDPYVCYIILVFLNRILPLFGFSFGFWMASSFCVHNNFLKYYECIVHTSM